MDDQSRIADPDPVATAVKELTSAPLRLVVDVDGEFGVFGIYDLYEEAANTLTERVEHARVMLIRGAATPAEQARMADTEAVLTGWGPFIQSHARRAQAGHLRDEWEGTFQDAAARAEKRGDLCACASRDRPSWRRSHCAAARSR